MFFVAQRTKGPAHGRSRRINLLFVSCKQHYSFDCYLPFAADDKHLGVAELLQLVTR